VAIVTGGTRGIGLGIARALARSGWHIALCGTRPESEVRGVVQELEGLAKVEAMYAQLDVSRTIDHQRFVDAVRDRFGTIDALVNNAGRAPKVRADLLEATEESFDEVLRTNLAGPYFLTQRVARVMVESRAQDSTPAPAIVFVTSVSAAMASPNRGEYCVSKAGLAMAAQLFAARLAADGIAVYEVRPGIVETDMTAPVKDVYDKRIAEGLVPARRWGTPDDVGRVVATVLGGDLPYATGSVIHVDGGLSIPRL
jgi:NAD(P)-dependent dehydrogenase (short-subunit alcohol dehydrogenase family)